MNASEFLDARCSAVKEAAKPSVVKEVQAGFNDPSFDEHLNHP